MRPFLGILIVLLAITSISCSGFQTGYAPLGDRGGFSDQRLDNNTFKVEFAGNANISRQTARHYLLTRCAELTLDAGFDHFIIVESSGALDHATFATSSTAPKDNTHVEGSGKHSPGSAAAHASAVIKTYRGSAPTNDPAAYDAHQLLQPR